MNKLRALCPVPGKRLSYILLVALCALVAGGCSRVIKNPVRVAPFIEPKVKSADTAQLIAEVNRLAAVRSLRGKVDLQFLDNSFAKCGIVEKYSTAEGNLILQRPGQIYLSIQALLNIKVADMASDGTHFEVAIFQGDQKYRNFIHGTNNALYGRVSAEDADDAPDCGHDGKQQKDEAMQKRAVSAFSGLRPQHLTDALLVPPIEPTPGNLIYVRSEAFNEEPDERPGAKKGARLVRSYYTLEELVPAGTGQARLLRRFWFDRTEKLRLARVQTFDERGHMTTDVVYKNQRPFGAEGQYELPASIELTRPQDRYSIRITYQAPADVKVDQPFEASVFVLENNNDLPDVDLDKKER